MYRHLGWRTVRVDWSLGKQTLAGAAEIGLMTSRGAKVMGSRFQSPWPLGQVPAPSTDFVRMRLEPYMGFRAKVRGEQEATIAQSSISDVATFVRYVGGGRVICVRSSGRDSATLRRKAHP